MAAVFSLTAVIGGIFYLTLTGKDLQAITGAFGSLSLKLIFNELGYATFLIAISTFALGQYVAQHCLVPQDIWDYKTKILYNFVLQVCFVVVTASFLTVLHQHYGFPIHSQLKSGAGGQAGLFIGGSLYSYVGLFGALVTLTSFILITGIMAGYIELVSIGLWIRDYIHYLIQEIWIRSKQAYFWAREKFSYDKEIVADAFLEFEAASGTYRYSNLPPQMIQSFSDEAVNLEGPALKNSEIQINSDMSAIPVEHTERKSDIQLEREESAALKKQRQFAKAIANMAKTQRMQESMLDAAADLGSEVESDSATEEPKKRTRKRKATKDTAASADAENSEESEAAESSEEENSDEIRVTKYTKRYSKPDLTFLKKAVSLKKPSAKAIEEQCQNLETRLTSFKLTGKIVEVHVGNRLTMFEFMPDAGVKLSKIAGLANDLALLLGADSIRILTPIPGKTTVGIEVPNSSPTAVNASELIKPAQKAAKEKALPIALGKNVYNNIVMADLASMPHLLVSGTTGSGKSVFINSLINSLLYTRSPKELRFLMVDPKMIELSPYNGIPHLLKPVVTDVVEAKDTLVWAEKEMDRRYQIFGATGARNIESFNEKVRNGSQSSAARRAGKKGLEFEWMELPYIVVIIDELADLMITQGKDVEIPITRIAQKARAAGIHLVIATQRPSAEIVTGLIKTNFPTRIAFKVSSAIDSRTILDSSGAEKLLGHGDMLYMPQGKAIERLQGGFLSEDEVKKIVRAISLK